MDALGRSLGRIAKLTRTIYLSKVYSLLSKTSSACSIINAIINGLEYKTKSEPHSAYESVK